MKFISANVTNVNIEYNIEQHDNNMTQPRERGSHIFTGRELVTKQASTCTFSFPFPSPAGTMVGDQDNG